MINTSSTTVTTPGVDIKGLEDHALVFRGLKQKMLECLHAIDAPFRSDFVASREIADAWEHLKHAEALVVGRVEAIKTAAQGIATA